MKTKKSAKLTEAELQQFIAGTFTGGGNKAYGKSAYMLIYERKTKKPIHEYHDVEGQDEKKEVELDFRSIK